MTNKWLPVAGFCLLAGIASVSAQPPVWTPGGANPVAPGTEGLPWYARVPLNDSNNQPPIVDIGVPAGHFEFTGRVIRLSTSTIILADRIGLSRVIPIGDSTWVKQGPSSGSWEQIQQGKTVTVRGVKGKAADTVELVED
jgi:hypothetical protein